MPIEVEWFVPRRVILQRFYGEITLEDIRQSDELIEPLMAEGIPLIHTIIDASEVESHPSMKDIQNAATNTKYEGEGWRVLVGAGAIARFIGSIILQLMGQRYRMYDTLEEAVAFLHDQDPSIELPDSFTRTGT
ncbi:MAG TPA: hypothetical protein VKY59_06440 [Spirillospora sp.]|nr:hypothetical protein [Spirillospora sp.]